MATEAERASQEWARTMQGYTPKAVPQVCGNCHYIQEGRCGLGGFTVKKMGTCNEWAGTDNEGTAND